MGTSPEDPTYALSIHVRKLSPHGNAFSGKHTFNFSNAGRIASLGKATRTPST
jgi:hypothetical protein